MAKRRKINFVISFHLRRKSAFFGGVIWNTFRMKV